MSIGEDISPPAPLNEFNYPQWKHTPTYYRWPVVLQLTISKEGTVSSVCDLSEQREIDMFVEMVRNVKFKPGIYRGEPVATIMELPIHLPAMEGAIEKSKKHE